MISASIYYRIHHREKMMSYHINRQLGDYVIYSKEANVAPFFVRMAGDESPLSTHWNISDACNAILRLQADAAAKLRR